MSKLPEEVHYYIFEVAIHTAGSRYKNRYVNICKYVDSLQQFAISSPTSVVAHFLGLNPAALSFFSTL